MKKLLWTGLFLFLGILGASSVTPFPALGAGDNPTGDLTQNIEVFAASGVLKFHGRNETQYRDLTPGSHPLTSGSFLKTGSGSADILLADNSVLSLDANTEVQVGLYENGMLIVQRSGRAHHAVTPQAGKRYVVKTRYFAARAVGTEFRTIENYPVDGAVTVEWGEVQFVYTEWDPATGQPRDIYDFVPEGSTIIWPPDTGAPTALSPGDHEVFHAMTTPSAHAIGEKRPAPPDDAWTRHTRDTGRLVRDLRRRYYGGKLTAQQYSQLLREGLGLGPGSMPGRPGPQLGGFWIGNAGDIFYMRFCKRGNNISDIHIVDEWQGQDKQTHEVYMHRVGYTIPGTHFIVEENGRIDGSYEISDPDSLWRGAYLQIRGYISGGTGRIFVNVTSETDVAVYLGTCSVIEVRLVDPNGCNY